MGAGRGGLGILAPVWGPGQWLCRSSLLLFFQYSGDHVCVCILAGFYMSD